MKQSNRIVPKEDEFWPAIVVIAILFVLLCIFA